MTLREIKDAAIRKGISEALDAHSWDIDEAARALDIDRTNVYRYIRKFGLTRPASERAA